MTNKWLPLALLLAAGWAGPTLAAEPQQDGPGPVRIVAHRGAMTERPECTLSAIARAIELGADAVELDVRTSRDGVLFLLHDPTLDRTTNGRGPAAALTMAQLKQLDAGSHFDRRYRGERIPTLAEALALCGNSIDVLLDLKEQGETYAQRVAQTVRKHGRPERTILGVRSVAQARRFRRLLPEVRQLAFVAGPEQIDAFVQAGVQIVRLWPRWLDSPEGKRLVERLRQQGVQLQLNARQGTLQEILPLLRYRPDWLLVDDVARLKQTLERVRKYRAVVARLEPWVEIGPGATAVGWVSGPGEPTFLNRAYRMLELPAELVGQVRVMFAGGEGDRVRLRFRRPAVVFAALEYNATGAWSFPEDWPPEAFGWRLFRPRGYRGTSNATLGGKPHYAGVYVRAFQPGEELTDMPPWWVCLGIVHPEAARRILGPEFALRRPGTAVRPFLYTRWATRPRPLRLPELRTPQQWTQWQDAMRAQFRRRLVFRYEEPPQVVEAGKPQDRGEFIQQEFHVLSGRQRLFRFFKLVPKSLTPGQRRATIVCFMGHGKVDQILRQRESYQRACAARFAEAGYVVFAMENVGMEPGRDRHLELDRVLRLDGYGWYSLLFAHQLMLLDWVFADANVDPRRVGATGVSTGGLLALSAIALDRRVKAASVHGIFGSMRMSFIRDRRRHCSCGAIPGLLPQFDLPQLALLAAPRPLHISNASRDGFTPAEARRCLRLIAPYYRQAGGDEPLFTEPPGGHVYAFDPALAFFRKHLGDPRQAPGR